MELVVAALLVAGLLWFVWRHRRPNAAAADGGRAVMHMEGDGDFAFDVVGEANYQDAIDVIVGGKTEDGHEHECLALLVREPENRHDRNAIAVFIDSRKVGYVPRREAAAMSKLLDRKGHQSFTADALIVGGWSQGRRGEGHYGVKLDLPV